MVYAKIHDLTVPTNSVVKYHYDAGIGAAFSSLPCCPAWFFSSTSSSCPAPSGEEAQPSRIRIHGVSCYFRLMDLEPQSIGTYLSESSRTNIQKFRLHSYGNL